MFISIICGIVNFSSGWVLVDGYDVVIDYCVVCFIIGLVLQEFFIDVFESVWDMVWFSCGLYGKFVNNVYLEKVLKDLFLWDKCKNCIMELFGGMKCRVLIVKVLLYELGILFLDEFIVGVDVELCREMWEMVCELREQGVIIIFIIYYIEEVEEMVDCIGVISKGEIVLVEKKDVLM